MHVLNNIIGVLYSKESKNLNIMAEEDFKNTIIIDSVSLIDMCNGDVKGFPGGFICIGELVSEGVLVVWSRR